MTKKRVFPLRIENEIIRTMKSFSAYQGRSVSDIIRDMILVFISSNPSFNTIQLLQKEQLTNA